MGKCHFEMEIYEEGQSKIWTCPLEAEKGKKYCFWHEKRKRKKLIEAQLQFLKENDIKGIYLAKAELSKADLNGANLQSAKLEGANLKGAWMDGANLQDAELHEANLQKAGLVGANLQDSWLLGANLQNADLRGANLQNADLRGANLQNADLRGANLLGAMLEEANLQNADLEEANLQGASLGRAKLRGADLEKAILQDADFSYANLSCTFLRSARIDQNTEFSDAQFNFAQLDYSYVDQTKSLRYAIFYENKETNEIIADFLKNKKRTVLDAGKVEESFLELYLFLVKAGATKYMPDGKKIFLFDSKNNHFITSPNEPPIELPAEKKDAFLEKLKDLIFEELKEKGRKKLREKLYSASYRVFNMLYNFHLQNGTLEEALRFHRKKNEVRRKQLWLRGGLNALRAVFYDWFILKVLTNYGTSILRPILASLGTIFGFAFLYRLTDGVVKIVNGLQQKPDLWDYLYYSVITFTSLGYSNEIPNLANGIVRLLVGIESLLGAFFMALIIFTITFRVSK